MESEENVALLERQKECLNGLQEKHNVLIERAQDLCDEDSECSELEEIKEVRKIDFK